MKNIYFLFLFIGCTSLRNEHLNISDLSIKDSKTSGFIASRYMCMSHIGTDCKWVPWTFPEQEKQIKDLLNKRNVSLINAKYSYKPGGMSWYTLLSIGIIPSEMVYSRELRLTYSDKKGEKSSFVVRQEYGIMAGWLAVFFGPLRTTSAIHGQKDKEFMNSISNQMVKIDR